MITNFDYLKTEPKFKDFADVAISAEKIIIIDPEASIINSRRAMEFAVKWMYSVDDALEMPYKDNLYSLMDSEDYKQIIGYDLWKRMDYIRITGNKTAHNNKKKLRMDEAMLCLENLFIYLDYIAYCFADKYEERSFDKNLIISNIEEIENRESLANSIKEELKQEIEKSAMQELDLKKLMEENKSLKEKLSIRRQENEQTYSPKPLKLSEYRTTRFG